MLQKLFLLLALPAFWLACKNNSGESVQEIRDSGANSSIIRNPMSATENQDTNQLARIVFEGPEFDFGQVNEGDMVTHEFKFTNTGKVALVILDAKSSCGCTVPLWPENAIKPGETGVITAKFNTDGKPEQQKKLIRVTANTFPGVTTVALKGYVVPKKK